MSPPALILPSVSTFFWHVVYIGGLRRGQNSVKVVDWKVFRFLFVFVAPPICALASARKVRKGGAYAEYKNWILSNIYITPLASARLTEFKYLPLLSVLIRDC